MGTKRAERLASSMPWLDQVAGVVQNLFAPIVGKKAPRGLKDTLVGTWLGHPLHPAVVDLPIGAWMTAFALDLAGEESAADLAIGLGLSGAMVAAVTGAAQFQDATNDEMPRRLGALHVLANTAATTCYAGSLAMRKSGARSAGFALSLAGLGFVAAAGQLGGDLAYDLGLGVDHTAFEQPPEKWTDVLAEFDLVEGKLVAAKAKNVPVMLIKKEDGISAFSSTCPHLGGPLAKGKIDGDTVTCPWHGSVFSLTDGHLVHGPATAPITLYEVRIKSGRVEIRAE
jgi:nitrite reductase/ring-hydroxylating ferredoxin subunit/uncharacterized membrane protein